LEKRAEKKRDNCAAVNYLIDLLVAARPKKALHLAVVAAAVPASSTVNAHAAAASTDPLHHAAISRPI
jgi:hypothetical protein